MLYQPTSAEIDAVARSSVERFPFLASRWTRAAAILDAVNRSLSWDGESWRCSSQTADCRNYPLDLHSCACRDCQEAGATVKGIAFCKHKLALHGYRRILGQQIDARTLGVYSGRADLDRLRSRPNNGLLFTQRAAPGLALYLADRYDHIPTRLCAVRYTAQGNVPDTEADLFASASWLAQAVPLPPVYEPAPAGWDDPVAREWQPQMSTADFQRWLATGVLPVFAD